MLQREAATGREAFGTASTSNLAEYLTVLRKRAPMIGLATLLVGGGAFGGASLLPKKYTSVAYLELSQDDARRAAVIMRSPAIYDPIIARFPTGPDAGIDESRREMAHRIAIRSPPGDTVGKGTGWSMIEVTGPSPQIAQSMATLLLDTWLELMKPRPTAGARIRESIDRTEAQLKSVDDLIRRLQADPGSPQSARTSKVTETDGPAQGEVGWPLSNLLLQRDRLVETAVKLKTQLEGTPRDVIIVPPTLPSEASAPAPKLVGILAALATLTLMLAAFAAQLAFRSASRGRGGA